ncbi:MAG: hypothetical protein E2576_27705 [Alcaligenaceae bacterium]|nr:hypothetical protein [Alcaligenaceae bacterium]
MWLLLLEAFLALSILVFIVVWTMRGRRNPPAARSAHPPAEPDPSQPGSPSSQPERDAREP